MAEPTTHDSSTAIGDAPAGPGAGEWNATRFDPRAGKDHVESFFLKANDPSGERALWLRATIFASAREPDRALAEGWAIAFDRRGGTARHVAVKQVLPFAQASFDRSTLGVRWPIGGGDGKPAEARVELQPGKARGSLSMRDHSIAWDLRFSGEDRPIVPFFDRRMYTGPFPKSKLVTPVPDARFEGELTVDGQRWAIDGWRGMQGHNWGRGHADLYAWCHANVWEQEDELVLEGLSGRVRVGPVLTPLTTVVCVRYRGVSYDFTRPMVIWRAHGDVTTRRWSFSAQAPHSRIEGMVEARTDDMVGLYYANPDGAMTYCLNSKLASARVRFEPKGRAPLTLTSRAAALEVGTRDADHGVRMQA
jgi:hypothetical protein